MLVLWLKTRQDRSFREEHQLAFFSPPVLIAFQRPIRNNNNNKKKGKETTTRSEKTKGNADVYLVSFYTSDITLTVVAGDDVLLLPSPKDSLYQLCTIHKTNRGSLESSLALVVFLFLFFFYSLKKKENTLKILERREARASQPYSE